MPSPIETAPNPLIREVIAAFCRTTTEDTKHELSRTEGSDNSRLFAVGRRLLTLLRRVDTYEYGFSVQGQITPEEVAKLNETRHTITDTLSWVLEFLQGQP